MTWIATKSSHVVRSHQGGQIAQRARFDWSDATHATRRRPDRYLPAGCQERNKVAGERFRWPIIHAAEDNSVTVSQIHERRPRRSTVV